jgi:molybdopterin-containing oxidoreductase family membrane subunit
MKSYEKLVHDLAPREFGKQGKIWVGFLLIVIFAALIAYYQQIRKGLSITHLNDYVLWGVYISNFVFFVAISLVGSLVTAILRLSGAKWSTPLTRISEVIAVAAIIMAGLTIIIDMGRPERIYNIFLHGRLQSPIIWDVLVISTYLFISLMLLFFPLLPDFAILKKHFENKPKLSRVYAALSLNWTGSKYQEGIYNKSISILSILIIPVAFGIHTVTAWLFATTYRPGWDSSNFGPYFIAGAFVAGAGSVVVIMYVLRRIYNLEHYITDFHFDKMGKLLVLLCLVYLYFNINEYLVPAYKTTEEESDHLYELFAGDYAPLFWTVIVGGLIVPIFILLFKKGRKPLPLFIVGILVVLGAWWKRYLIVTPTLLHPFLPFQGVPKSWHSYFPSALEWTITFGTLASALLIMTLLFRYLPIIPIHETAEEKGLLKHHKNEEL